MMSVSITSTPKYSRSATTASLEIIKGNLLSRVAEIVQHELNWKRTPFLAMKISVVSSVAFQSFGPT
jgi:hypothetical protein